MNIFYERLAHFGEIVQEASQKAQQDLSDYFTVLHPPHPVVASPASNAPKIQFTEDCPVSIRRKIRSLFRKSFNRVRAKF